ncbi:MAG: arginyltransferase [Planctomycetota bacterium]|nr:MAG: arginyltransferase [Planctomycetota bacterium]
MRIALREISPPSPCGYLPDRDWRMEHIRVESISGSEYQSLMEKGWRHFGHWIFRPVCVDCQACKSIRIPAATFKPNRSQRRISKANSGLLEPVFKMPELDENAVDLFDRWHHHQTEKKGWPKHESGNFSSFHDSFVDQPFCVEAWHYYLNKKLVGLGFVDYLPHSLSAVYFCYDPEILPHSPGIWNVLRMVEEAKKRSVPYVYLGYWVEGCAVMEYKRRFGSAEILNPEGQWVPLEG